MSKSSAELTLSVPVSKADMEAYTDVVYADIADADLNGVAAHNNDQGVHGAEEKFNSVFQELRDIDAELQGKQDLSGFTAGAKANVAGDTFTGTVEIESATPNIKLNTTGVAGKVISGERNGLKRWELILGDDTAETGANNGSLLKVDRYSDAGNRLGTSLAIDRNGTMYVNALDVENGDYYEVEQLDIHWDNVEPVAPPAGKIWMLKEDLAPGKPGLRPLPIYISFSLNPDVSRISTVISFPENVYASRIETVNNAYFITAFSDTKDYFRYNGVTYTVTRPTTDTPYNTLNRDLVNTWLFVDGDYVWFIYTTVPGHDMVVHKINYTTMDIQTVLIPVVGEFDMPRYGKLRYINLPNGKIGLMVLHHTTVGTLWDTCRFDLDPETMTVTRVVASSGQPSYSWLGSLTSGWNKHLGYQMVWSKGFFEDIQTPYDTFGEGATFVSYVTHVSARSGSSMTIGLHRIIHGADSMRIDTIGSTVVPSGLMNLQYQLVMPPTENRRHWWTFTGDGSNDLWAWQSPDVHTLFRRDYGTNDSIKWYTQDGWIETTNEHYVSNDEVQIMSEGYVNNYPSFNIFVSTDTGAVYNGWAGNPQFYALQEDVANVRYDGKLMYIYSSGTKDAAVYVYTIKTLPDAFTAGWENNGGLIPAGTAFANPWPTIYSREPSRATSYQNWPETHKNNTSTNGRIQLDSTAPTSQLYIAYSSTDRGAVSKTYPYLPLVQPQQANASSSGFYDFIPTAGKDFQTMLTAHGVNSTQWIDNPSLIYSYYNARFGWIGKMEDESRRYWPLDMTVPARFQNGVAAPTDSYLTIPFEFHIYNDNGVAKYDLKLISGLNSRDMTARPQDGPGGSNYYFDLKPKLRFKYYDNDWNLLKTVDLMSANSDNVVIQSWGTPNYTRTGVMPDWQNGTKWILPQIWTAWNLTRWTGYPQGHWVAVENVNDSYSSYRQKPLYIPTPAGVA
jgi:hypothetical protein